MVDSDRARFSAGLLGVRVANALAILSLAVGLIAAAGSMNAAPDAVPGGEQASTPKLIDSLQEPAAVAVSRDGSIYVCEALGARVSVFTLQGKLLRRWGSFGQNEAQFDNPRGIAVDADGTVYVADTGNHRIQVFNASGNLLRTFGRFGSDSGEFNEPRGLAVTAERVYVSDSLNDRVSVFDRHGVFQFYVWSNGYHDGAFDHPVDIAVDADGAFFVSDQGNSRIQKFDRTGRFISSFGGSGRRGGLLASPGGIELIHRQLYVSDPRTRRLLAFDGTGSFSGDWVVNRAVASTSIAMPSDLAAVPGSDALVLCSALENRCQVVSIARDLVEPSAVGVHPEVREGYTIGGRGNDVVIGSPEAGALMVLDVANDPPRWLARIGSPGHEPLEFVRPAGFDFDRSSGTLLVSDSGNRRLQQVRLAPSAQDPTRFDSIATRFIKLLDLADPEALNVDPGNWEITPKTLEPGAMVRTSQGDLVMLDVVSRRVVMLDSRWHLLRAWGRFGNESSEFRHPVGLAFDRTSETILVLDAAQSRVQRFDTNGRWLGAWGTRGSQPGEFLAPTGIAVASDGSVLIVDRGTALVQRFDAQGRLRNAWGAHGTARGALINPEGIYVDARDRVLVLDSGNRRLQAFTLAGEFLWEFPLDSRPGVSR
ncbi:MAG: NHL repeat-containing protein [Acidobacteriota bacterium]